MNIKEFLIDNYIWILVIILITIITIIGFLADKKKNGKKNEGISQPNNNNNVNVQPLNNMGQMQYNMPEQTMSNQVNNNMVNPMQPINNVNMQNTPNLVNMNNIQPMEQPMMTTIPTNVEVMNNPMPIENMNQNVTPEPVYKPLSEQKPVFSPQPVPNFSNVSNNQPMNVRTVDNVENTSMRSGIQQVAAPVAQQPYVQGQPLNQNQNLTSQMQPQMNNNNIVNIPNFNQVNTTIPEPINTVPVPKPVNPQPIMQEQYNNNQQMLQPNKVQQPMQPMSQQGQSQMVPNSPINFVYGPQNNNQKM